MQFTEELQLSSTQISKIDLKMKDGGAIQSRLQIKTILTPELAQQLGCHDIVFGENDTPREGFTDVALDGGCAAFRALFEVTGLTQTLELNGDSVTDVEIDKVRDGLLRMRLRLNVTGDPMQLINYWMQVGEAYGHCKVSPLAQELAAVESIDKAQLLLTGHDGATQSVDVPKDVFRNAMAASKRTPSTGPVTPIRRPNNKNVN